jgi:diguanylate cyclase (GGDEF)-like protein
MQASQSPFPVIPFVGVVVQLGGAAMLIGLFGLLRRYVIRRTYFGAWAMAWSCLAVASIALLARYAVAPDTAGDGRAIYPAALALYGTYQLCQALGLAYLVRGTLMYVSGTRTGFFGAVPLWFAAIAFAIVSTVAASNGLNEMLVWQSAIAVPMLGYCAAAMLRLPASRQTSGSRALGVSFGLLALFALAYAGSFGVMARGVGGPLSAYAEAFVRFDAYVDTALELVLGYAMVVVLMEDAKREIDDAQTQLRVTHDQLRRAALYDAMTDSLNRQAFAEGVGLEMVRATFGTVVLADLDNLKTVNDRFGHAAGDRLLRRCADVIRATLRPYDKLYRWGGDEFLLIVPSARSSDVLRRLDQALAEAQPIDADMPDGPRLQVSLGAADYSSSEELQFAIDRADRLMYQDKTRRKTDPRGYARVTVDTPASIASV